MEEGAHHASEEFEELGGQSISVRRPRVRGATGRKVLQKFREGEV